MAKQRNPKGTGYIRRKKNGTYEWRQRIDGKERYLTAKTPKELQAKINAVVDLPIITEKIKVDEWFSKWLDIYIKPLKKSATYNQLSY